jgi:hypothetical protein
MCLEISARGKALAQALDGFRQFLLERRVCRCAWGQEGGAARVGVQASAGLIFDTLTPFLLDFELAGGGISGNVVPKILQFY